VDWAGLVWRVGTVAWTQRLLHHYAIHHHHHQQQQQQQLGSYRGKLSLQSGVQFLPSIMNSGSSRLSDSTGSRTDRYVADVEQLASVISPLGRL